jgi:hypothetical protein
MNQSWESCIEVVDWRRKRWRFNYSRRVTSTGWCLDWEILTPEGTVKASGENDVIFADRCLNESGLIDQELLQFEFNWFVTHYTNTINIKLLKSIQSEVEE